MRRFSTAVWVLAFAAAGVGFLLLQHQGTQLQQEHLALSEAAQHLEAGRTGTSTPRPSALPAASNLPPADFSELLRLRGESGRLRRQTNDLARIQADNRRLREEIRAGILNGNVPNLTPDQIDAYLRQTPRSAQALLAVYRLTGEPAWLDAAAREFPQDPRVRLVSALEAKSPAERRQQLEALAVACPDNALVNYLAARGYFQAGQPERALQELAAGAAKPRLTEYAADLRPNLEAAYLAAGFAAWEAKAAACRSSPELELNELGRLRQNLAELLARYRQDGDEDGARATLALGLQLGRRLAEEPASGTILHEMVGLGIQRGLLEKLDPAGTYDDTGQTARERLAEIAQRAGALRDIGRQEQALLPSLTDPDLAAFFDRVQTVGEAAAVQWAGTRPRRRRPARRRGVPPREISVKTLR